MAKSNIYPPIEIGKKYHRWLILSEALPRLAQKHNRPNPTMYARLLCHCDCGTERIVAASALKNGHSQSCGCLNKEVVTALKLKHGDVLHNKSSPEHRAWVAMRHRCNNANNVDFHRYGGRGIGVCERWNDYINFLADMGRRPSSIHSIDRWPNNDGNYEPSNCRWATPKEQASNRSTNKH